MGLTLGQFRLLTRDLSSDTRIVIPSGNILGMFQDIDIYVAELELRRIWDYKSDTYSEEIVYKDENQNPRINKKIENCIMIFPHQTEE